MNRVEPGRIILVTLGSSGDVHPFVGIGRALARRGHEVIVATSEPFREIVEKAGLAFRSILSTEAIHSAAVNPDLWKPFQGLGIVLDVIAPTLSSQYEQISSLYQPGRTLLVAHPLALSPRVFQEAHRARLVTIHVSPQGLHSLIAPAAFAPGRDFSHLPRFVYRATRWAVDRWVIDPHVAPALNALRQALSLPPISRVYDTWFNSPQRIIGLFPSWFAPPPPDWPRALRLTGFPLYDETDQHAPSADLATFLDAGDRPILFSPGSASHRAPEFFEAALDASARLQERAVVVSPDPRHLPAHLPATVRHEAYVPLSHILPRCKAIVHHGGLGTAALALAAGVPQVTMPTSFDQPDNATRLQRLNVGRWILPSAFTGTTVASALRELLSDPAVAEACQRYCSAMREAKSSIDDTCDLLEAELAQAR